MREIACSPNVSPASLREWADTGIARAAASMKRGDYRMAETHARLAADLLRREDEIVRARGVIGG